MTTVKQQTALQREIAEGKARQAAVAEPNSPGGMMEDDPQYEPLKAQHTRGQAIVFEQNTQTYTLTYQTALATLRLATVERDVRENTRHRYERAHKACKDAAERLATHTGKAVGYPAWIGPPTEKEEDFVMAEPGGFDAGHYVETRGMGKSGKGIPIPIPGSAADHSWADINNGGKKS